MQFVDVVLSYSREHGHVRESMEVIEKSFAEMGDNCGRMCVSFNGGKDCTVLLPLILAVKVRRNVPGKLNCLYVVNPDPFPEMEHFLEQSVQLYDLHVIRLPGPAKRALFDLKTCSDGQMIEDIFMGTRSTDMRQKMSHLQATDSDWPAYRRVSPILHWSYRQVWNFILDLKIPYCPLYDRGYTSIGSVKNTFRNPKLKATSPTGDEVYLPAHQLEGSEFERCGRDPLQSC